jgi:beta-glucosidase/6-phospho-beta-glucosidase/beta-galactosidase
MLHRALLVIVLLAGTASAAVERPFPPGFLWGTAISGFQSDMGVGTPTDPNSDWWVWAHDFDNISSGGVSGDLPESGPGFYLRFQQDALLAQRKLGNNALRMGIEWSRLFPTSTAAVDISGGITPAVISALDALADQDEVTHYRAVFAALRARGLEPVVTINHFSLPLWIHDPIGVRDAFDGVGVNAPVPSGLTQAGWLDPAIVPEFEKLAAYAGAKFGDLVDIWCTINEPIVILVSGFINFPGVGTFFPPGVFNFNAVLQAIPNLAAAHARAYDALHVTDTTDANGDGVPVAAGVVHNMVAFHPKDPMVQNDIDGAAHGDYIYNRVFLHAITSGAFDTNIDGDTTDPGETRPDLAGRSDFIGVNYYLRADTQGLGFPVSPVFPLFDFLPTFAYATPQNPGGDPCPTSCTDFGWQIYPEGLREMLTFAGSLGPPIYITENGLADAADAKRAKFIFDHLSVVQDVIADGVADVRGFFHWSLTDNFEWSSGYYPKFGLFAFDPVTGRRKTRRSARVYRTIARRNGITTRLITRYGP